MPSGPRPPVQPRGRGELPKLPRAPGSLRLSDRARCRVTGTGGQGSDSDPSLQVLTYDIRRVSSHASRLGASDFHFSIQNIKLPPTR